MNANPMIGILADLVSMRERNELEKQFQKQFVHFDLEQPKEFTMLDDLLGLSEGTDKLKKRQRKKLLKEKEMYLAYLGGEKPKSLSKRYKMKPDEVYACVSKIKSKLIEMLERDTASPHLGSNKLLSKRTRTNRVNDEDIL